MIVARPWFIAPLSLLLSACVLGRSSRVSPTRAAAVAEARGALARAANDRDLDAFLRRLAPGATLVIGRDTFDLRAAAVRLHADLASADSTRLWLAPRRLRQCDQWIIESGGQVGMNVARPGSQPSRSLYRYALAWTTDSAGNPQVRSLALVPGDFGGQPPRVEGCRPSAKERFAPRRAGLALLPGTGFSHGGALGSIEEGLRNRQMDPRLYGDAAGYPAPGQTSPPLAAAWVRAWHRWWLETVTALGTTTTTTSAADRNAGSLVGTRFQQKWTAVLASAHWRELRIGAGPAYVREAWHVSVDSFALDTATSVVEAVTHVANAGSTRDRVGLYAQAAFLVPLTDRAYVELRGYVLSPGRSLSPRAFNTPSLRVNARSGGLGVTLGIAF